ncbi:MAG: peptidoglycan-binding protein [Limimaricola sp.]|nr:peptidoglycan-binding protein [Limimaricola sp.]
MVWLGLPAAAQTSWVQVQALPTLTEALDRARSFAARLPDVNGFVLQSGWYTIALGPYNRPDADAVLAQLQAQGEIPADSFVSEGGLYTNRFWPVGAPPPAAETATNTNADTGTGADTATNTASDGAETDNTTLAAAPQPAPEPIIDETPAEARASEARLTADERMALQIALQWAGVYNSGIDGAFGPGTRSAMAAWQTQKGYDATGVLTTGQRAELLSNYNRVLTEAGMKTVQDTGAGIEIQIPAARVAFGAYNPPFADYPATDGSKAHVVLISQPGDANRMAGLYEIMQTLALVPPNGPRGKSSDGFEIDGQDASIHSYTWVTLKDGTIKGFTLVWPADEEGAFKRIRDAMKSSFRSLDGVLDPGLVPPGEEQSVDMVSGLAVRKPQLTRSGFFISADGMVLTTTDAVKDCARVTVDDEHDAAVTFTDPTLGIAVLTPAEKLAPLAVAEFQTAVPRLQSEVAVGGYSFGGVLSAPSVTFGKLADVRGLSGEDSLRRLEVATEEGDSGGPVFDSSGAVLGMLAPSRPADGRVLPAGVGFSVDSAAIVGALDQAGVEVTTTDTTGFMPAPQLARRAADTTALVSCW